MPTKTSKTEKKSKTTNKGRYLPRNPQKYIGNVSNILFRSSWELNVMKFLDGSPGVLKWASEEIGIKYLKPTDNMMHTYFPDFFVVFQDKYGNIKKEIWEIKPLKEVRLTEKSSLYDKAAIAVNRAKWVAATAYARSKGLEFRILTEASLFRNVAPIKPDVKAPRGTKEQYKQMTQNSQFLKKRAEKGADESE